MLQYVVVCCSVLQRVTVAVREAAVAVIQRNILCCIVLHCVAACCSVLQRVMVAVRETTAVVNQHTGLCCSAL